MKLKTVVKMKKFYDVNAFVSFFLDFMSTDKKSTLMANKKEAAID